jgi:hypothetical protein
LGGVLQVQDCGLAAQLQQAPAALHQTIRTLRLWKALRVKISSSHLDIHATKKKKEGESCTNALFFNKYNPVKSKSNTTLGRLSSIRNRPDMWMHQSAELAADFKPHTAIIDVPFKNIEIRTIHYKSKGYRLFHFT